MTGVVGDSAGHCWGLPAATFFPMLAVSAAMAIVGPAYGHPVFRRMESRFADMV
jgi:hypothetical protein